MLEEKVDFDVINVPSKAGDLVIWDTRMAHGTSPNRSTVPRFAQYLSMCPAEPEHAELLEIRLASFEKLDLKNQEIKSVVRLDS